MAVDAPAGARCGARQDPARARVIAVTWAALLAYAAVIYWLSSRSSVPLPLDLFPGEDKVLHAWEYAGLAVLLAVAQLQSGISPWRAGTIAVLGAIAFGASDEWHQSFVPGRDASLFDLAADAVGAAAGTALLFAALRRRRARPGSGG
jgi:VanZ family protein